MQQAPHVGFVKTVYCLGSLRWRLIRQEKYARQRIPLLLASLKGTQEGEVPARELRRMIKYWQLALNIVCHGLYKLRGRQLSPKEKDTILLLSVFSPLYDDLFDDQLLSHDEIEAFTLEPEKTCPGHYREELARNAYLRLLEQVPDRQELIRRLHRVFQWQKASLKQMSPDIGEEELYEVTYNKSYSSILLFHAILDHPPTPAVLEMLYPMAGLLQLTNDAFDVYKDLQSGIYTLPNLYGDYEKLLQHFMQEVKHFNSALRQLPFLGSRKAIYGITIHALHAMGRMALLQLKERTRGIHNMAELAQLSRQALVCDMDSWRQQLRWVQQVHFLVNYGSTQPTVSPAVSMQT